VVHHPDVVALMARQHSLITRHQALAAGLSASAIDRLVASGAWTRVGRAVYHLAGALFTWHTRVLAACLESGPGVASHRTAAVLHGLDGFRAGPPELIIPRGGFYRPGGVRVHEVRDFDLRREVRREAIPTCGLDVVLFQLAGQVGEHATGAVIDQALRERRLSWLDLYDTMVLHARRGRKGSALFRSILDTRFGERIPDSQWNRRVADLLVDAGLPSPTLEHEIHDEAGRFVARVDLGWPRHRVAVELQSMKHHLTEEAFHLDPLRRNRLQRLGWIVLEYTWRHYVDHPDRLCAEVRDHLHLRSVVVEPR
jgi:hypothetical protein